MAAPAEVYTQEAYFSSRLPYDPQREPLWQILCAYLQRDFPRADSILEIGGGYCHFINNVRARERYVVDVFPGVVQYAAEGVKAQVRSCTDLSPFPAGSLDVVFASNLFEHLTVEELDGTLTEVWRVLAPGGKLLIIQPNFKYCYREYFDDYTHRQIFTDVSLPDLLMSKGFQIHKVIPRFLPFSLKSSGPKFPWLLKLYLASPWRPLAGQMYIAAGKDKLTR
jgi:SAM-dependent methyltransferase